jgi:hypothetical protein
MNETKDEPTARDSLLSRETPDSVIGRRDPEPSMTPPDPVEEKPVLQMRRIEAGGKVAWTLDDRPLSAEQAAELLYAASLADRADTQSKDERIAELEGALERRERTIRLLGEDIDAALANRLLTRDILRDARHRAERALSPTQDAPEDCPACGAPRGKPPAGPGCTSHGTPEAWIRPGVASDGGEDGE